MANGLPTVALTPLSANRFYKQGRKLAMTRPIPTRRSMLLAGATALATPYVWSRPARAARQVVVRNPGGAYSDTQKRYVYDPFTKETGI